MQFHRAALSYAEREEKNKKRSKKKREKRERAVGEKTDVCYVNQSEETDVSRDLEMLAAARSSFRFLESRDEPGRGLYVSLSPARSVSLSLLFLSLYRPCRYDFSADIHLRVR